MAGYTLGFDDGGDVPSAGDIGPSAGLLPGGIIPDDDGAAPAPDQGSPEQQDAPQENAQAGAQPGLNPGGSGPLAGADFDPSHVPGNLKKIASYLMGQGGADPETAKKFEQGVKNEYPGISDDDANLMAVHKATELGGPAAGFAMVQYNRSAYNAKQSFAKAALNGIDGKAGNAQAAALAATQAGQHILDGSSTIFTADPGGAGFTATVKIPGTDRQVGFKLTPQQFNSWLDAGKAGMYDRVMEDGTPASLQKLAGAPPDQPQAPDQPPDDSQPAAPGQPPAATPPAAVNPYKAPHAQSLDAFPGSDMQFAGNTKADNAVDTANRKKGLFAGDQPAIPGTHDANGHYIGPKDDDDQQYSPELVARANKMFPMVGDEKQRQEWMSTQENAEAERQNKVDQATEKGKWLDKRADTMGGHRDAQVHEQTEGKKADTQTTVEGRKYNTDSRDETSRANAKTKADADQAKMLAKIDAQTKADALKAKNIAERVRITEKGKSDRALVLNGMMMDPKEKAAFKARYGIEDGAPAAPTGQAAPPPSGKAPAQNSAIDQARDAIKKGAPRDAVIKRLRDNGVDPGDL